LKCRTVVNQG